MNFGVGNVWNEWVLNKEEVNTSIQSMKCRKIRIFSISWITYSPNITESTHFHVFIYYFSGLWDVINYGCSVSDLYAQGYIVGFTSLPITVVEPEGFFVFLSQL